MLLLKTIWLIKPSSRLLTPWIKCGTLQCIFLFFYLKIIFKTIKVELLQTHGIRSAGRIYFLFLSLLYPTYAAIQARDKHSDITFFYKKSSQVFCKKLLCLAGMCGVAFQRGDKRVKYFIIHFNLMAWSCHFLKGNQSQRRVTRN